jgi:hypothetical protein
MGLTWYGAGRRAEVTGWGSVGEGQQLPLLNSLAVIFAVGVPFRLDRVDLMHEDDAGGVITKISRTSHVASPMCFWTNFEPEMWINFMSV